MHGHDDWYLTNVIFRPNVRADEKNGEYWPEPRKALAGKSLTLRALYYKTTGAKMKKLGATQEEVEASFQEWRKSYQGPER